MTLVFQLTPDISFFFEVILPVAKGSTPGRHGGSILRATSNEVGLRIMILQLVSLIKPVTVLSQQWVEFVLQWSWAAGQLKCIDLIHTVVVASTFAVPDPFLSHLVIAFFHPWSSN